MSSPADDKQQRGAEREARAAADEQAGRRRKRLGLLAGTALVAAAIVIVLALVSGGDSGPKGLSGGKQVAGAAATNRLFAGIPQRGIALGDPQAPVTVVEFVDLQCPFCGEFARNAMPEIVRRYVRPGRVRVELRVLHFLGDDSTKAAGVAAAAAQQNRMWQFTELFYRNQGTENTGYVTDSFLRGIAGAVDGLDADKALAAANGARAQNLIAQDDSAARTVGANSTPTFLAGRTGQPLQKVELTDLTAAALGSQIDRLLPAGR